MKGLTRKCDQMGQAWKKMTLNVKDNLCLGPTFNSVVTAEIAGGSADSLLPCPVPLTGKIHKAW